METLLSKLHFLIIGYALYNYNNLWTEREEALKSKEGQLPVITNSIRKATKQRKQLKSYFKNIEDAKERIEVVAQEVEKIQKKLPNEISDAEVLGILKGVADGLNLKNVYLTPTIEENKGFYYAKKYELKATGTFLQFLIFFEKISFNDRLLNIKFVKIGKSKEKQRGRFQIVTCEAIIEAYRYNSKYKVDRGFDKIEENFEKAQAAKKVNTTTRRRRRKKK